MYKKQADEKWAAGLSSANYATPVWFPDLAASSGEKSKARGVAAFICQLVYKNILKETAKLCLLHLYHESTTD